MHAPAGPALATPPSNVPRSIPSPVLVDVSWACVVVATPVAQRATGTSRLPQAQPVYHQSPQWPHRRPYWAPSPLRTTVPTRVLSARRQRPGRPPPNMRRGDPATRHPCGHCRRDGARRVPPVPVAHRRTRGNRRWLARASAGASKLWAHGRARGGQATGAGRTGQSGGGAEPLLGRAAAEDARGCALRADRRAVCCVKRPPPAPLTEVGQTTRRGGGQQRKKAAQPPMCRLPTLSGCEVLGRLFSSVEPRVTITSISRHAEPADAAKWGCHHLSSPLHKAPASTALKQ